MKKQVKFSSLQRLDLNDASALQGLVNEQLSLENYGLKGGTKAFSNVGGLFMTSLNCIAVGSGNGGLNDTNAYINLGVFSFMLPNGEVVQHTETSTNISYASLKNLAIGANATRIGYIWGNYNSVDTNEESREFWSAIDEAPFYQNVMTRTQKIPTFIIDTGRPANLNGRAWAQLGYVTVTNVGGVFKVANTAAVKQYNEMPGMLFYKPLEVTSSTSSTRFGLGPYWENIEEMFYKIITNGSADASDKTALNRGANPQYSLQGLKREIDKKSEIGVVASATLVFEKDRDTTQAQWRNDMNNYVSTGVGGSKNPETNRQKRYEYYNIAFNTNRNNEKETFIRSYSFGDIVEKQLLGCHFEDAAGNVITDINDIGIFLEDIASGSGLRRLGSQGLTRLVVNNAIDGASADLVDSIYGTNKIEIEVTPIWHTNSTLGLNADSAEYGYNDLSGLVVPVRQFDATAGLTDLQKFVRYDKLFIRPTDQGIKTYVDIDFKMCSPWAFPFQNEWLFRTSYDSHETPVAPSPLYLRVQINIYGNLSYIN